MRVRSWLLVAGCLWIVALAGCARIVSRDAWLRMSQDDRVLYVKTLIGEEKSKDAKGGTGLDYPLPAEEYARRIDEAYLRGDKRDAAAIFMEMGKK